jgi:uncharacterized YccA/Bax inhibitor family protein
MRTNNPIFKNSQFSEDTVYTRGDASGVEVIDGPGLTDRVIAGGRMTVMGAVNKTFLLLFLLICAAGWTWRLVALGGNPMPWLLAGLFVGLPIALLLPFKPTWAAVLGPIYAILQGFLIGAASALFERQYPGIVIHAVGLTIGVLACMLIAYRSGIIRVTDKFILGVVAATGAVFLVYMVDFILHLFGSSNPMIHSTGVLGIGVSVVFIIVAALNLVLDFHFFEVGQRNGAPKYMEWYAAFGLIVTLVWLYLEILRLLAKLKSR